MCVMAFIEIENVVDGVRSQQLAQFTLSLSNDKARADSTLGLKGQVQLCLIVLCGLILSTFSSKCHSLILPNRGHGHWAVDRNTTPWSNSESNRPVPTTILHTVLSRGGVSFTISVLLSCFPPGWSRIPCFVCHVHLSDCSVFRRLYLFASGPSLSIFEH